MKKLPKIKVKLPKGKLRTKSKTKVKTGYRGSAQHKLDKSYKKRSKVNRANQKNASKFGGTSKERMQRRKLQTVNTALTGGYATATAYANKMGSIGGSSGAQILDHNGVAPTPVNPSDKKENGTGIR